MINNLENIENQIHVLQRRAYEIRNSKPVPHHDFNAEILMKMRANRLKISTVKKGIKNSSRNFGTKTKSKIMSKIKVTLDPKTDSAKKLIVAAAWAGVTIVLSDVINPKKTAHELQFSRGEELIEVGKYLESLTDEQVTKELERIDKKKADAAKK